MLELRTLHLVDCGGVAQAHGVEGGVLVALDLLSRMVLDNKRLPSHSAHSQALRLHAAGQDSPCQARKKEQAMLPPSCGNEQGAF